MHNNSCRKTFSQHLMLAIQFFTTCFSQPLPSLKILLSKVSFCNKYEQFLPILEIYVLSLSNCAGSIGETENKLEYWDEKHVNETKEWGNLLTFSQGHLLSAHPHNLFSILQEHHCRYHTLDTHFFLVHLIHTVKKMKKLKLTAVIFLIILSLI